MSTECPSCGRDDFNSSTGMKIHHKRAHGESIAGVVVKCDYCGETKRMNPTQARESDRHFCDRSCQGNWVSENKSQEDHPCWEHDRIAVDCTWCGAEKEITPSEKNETGRYFCNRECLSAWRSSNRSGNNHPSWKGGKKTVHCAHCGAQKQVDPHEYKKYDRHFCNTQCKGEWQSSKRSGKNHPQYDRIEVDCAWCGESKAEPRYRAEAQERHYCGVECQGKWLSENQTGDDAPAWKGGMSPYGTGWTREKKEKIRESQQRVCAGCSTPEVDLPRKLDVHHIEKARWFDEEDQRNQEDNLVALCPSCHGRWEKMSPLRPQTTILD